jgi:AcrR family transcriptional regulator
MTATVITRLANMGRWEPDARGRLTQAAYELYEERGYEQTTVAEIAARAGLTERTFFRHFADKREVLFDGSNALLALFVDAIRDADPTVGPFDAMAAALHRSAGFFGELEPHSRRRQRIIASRPELQERELIKMERLAAAVAQALRERGVPEPAASLTAESGIGMFKITFARWVEEGNTRSFDDLVTESIAGLRSLAAG